MGGSAFWRVSLRAGRRYGEFRCESAYGVANRCPRELLAAGGRKRGVAFASWFRQTRMTLRGRLAAERRLPACARIVAGFPAACHAPLVEVGCDSYAVEDSLHFRSCAAGEPFIGHELRLAALLRPAMRYASGGRCDACMSL